MTFLANRRVLALVAGLAALALPLSWSLTGTVRVVSSVPGFLISSALEIGFYFHIARRAANRDDDMSLPPLDRLAAAVVGPTWRYLICLLPVLAGLYWFAARLEISVVWAVHFATVQPGLLVEHLGPTIVAGLGVLALPLFTLIALESRSAFSALSPLRWVAMLKALGARLAVGALIFYILTAVRWLVIFPAIERLRAPLEFSLALPWLVFAIQYAVVAIRARALGSLLGDDSQPRTGSPTGSHPTRCAGG